MKKKGYLKFEENVIEIGYNIIETIKNAYGVTYLGGDWSPDSSNFVFSIPNEKVESAFNLKKVQEILKSNSLERKLKEVFIIEE